MADAQQLAMPSVLVIAHDLSINGGVNNFLRIMRRRLRDRVKVSRFVNGRRKGEKGKFQAAVRIVTDYVRFIRVILMRPYDVLHVNPTLDFSSMPRELIFVWLTHFLRPHTGIIIFYRGWEWGTFTRLLGSRVGRQIFVSTQKRADTILVLADSFRNALIARGISADKIKVVSTMFEGEVLARVLGEEIVKENRTLLFLSRFLPAKGGVSVLHSVNRLRDRYPDLKLVMAGDGPQRAELEALTDELDLRDIVSYTGYIGSEEKMRHLVRAQIFLLPTAHPEGMPNAILEAMAAGDVIISTYVGGIPAIVQDGVHGKLLREPTADNLTAAIAEFLENPEHTRDVGRYNQSTAWTNWESAKVSSRIADEYDLLMRK